MSKTKTCGSCGTKGMTPFSGKNLEIKHGGLIDTVRDLSGWHCAACDDMIFDSDSAKRYAAAGDALVMRARESVGALIKNTRRKLHLTQKDAAELTGGGVNAFSRYETGKARPMQSVVNLFRLLDAHPYLLEEIRRVRNSSGTVTHAAYKIVKKQARSSGGSEESRIGRRVSQKRPGKRVLPA